ncbi:variant erythrocyte surface antigen-1 family protein [Babesia divergens]|uniref:Variant erythrocyte surface antigen-1 family protein n=1 Tax=Babesia divergens TaxID=32595 RepID=A0AAD9G6D5_BABDI|nr:variant erythrocyte surface antigen-1 family protein [Babesia divergens]
MAQPSATSDLLRCPKNLKECIDWIGCIKSQSKTSDLASAVKKVLGNSKGNVNVNDLITKLSEGLEGFLNGIKNNGSYTSSYNGAQWPVCGSSSQCSGCQNSSPSCPCKSSGPCPAGECCENCDVKKAAKIFLGFLPCLYYALEYLNEKCKGDWNALNISKDNSLGRFLSGMGYDVEKLNQDKKGGEIFTLLSSSLFPSSNPLQSLYDVSKEYFKSLSSLVPSPSSDSDSPPKDPLTVREILLWLSGLPFTPGFEALLNHCKGLCESTGTSKNSVNFNGFESSLYASCLRSPFVLAAIQWPGKSEIFYHNLSENSKSLYPEDPSDLFNMLVENVRKIFVPLMFLKFQCGRNAVEGGWVNCAYGRTCADKFGISSGSTLASSTSECCPSSNSNSASKGIRCTSSTNSNCHQHCTSSKPLVQCLGPNGECNQESDGSLPTDAHTSSGKCKDPCPHLLLRFLCDVSPFNLPGSFVSPMGFSDHLPTPGRTAKDLLGVVEAFCKNPSSPLTRLVQYSLCISRTPPETLLEFYVFFKIFVPKLNSTFKTNFGSYVKGEPGTPSAQDILNALQNLNGARNSHSTGDHSVASLYSLNDCDGPRGSDGPHPTCGKYLYPLTEDVYSLYVDDFVDTYLSWICYLPGIFRKKVKEFKGNFLQCCLSTSSSPCKSIIFCPCALALISSQGFVYNSPLGLGCMDNSGTEHRNGRGVVKHPGKEDSPGCTRKTCQNFIDQLEKVISPTSPLQKLLDAIDEFLWHIRKPFFFFVLAFWAFVISYFLYVQLYKLDLLHLKSHAHLSRSFKILPSTLFSDASSKLKDLSYFSL